MLPPVPIAPFQGPRLKVERAKELIAGLDLTINSFVERKPCRVVIEQDPKSSSHCWTIRQREPVPVEWSILLGDAIHNLRSALDLLATALVKLNGGDPTNVNFPFSNTPEDFQQAISRGHIDRAGPAVVDVIRALKPYKGGNDALWGCINSTLPTSIGSFCQSRVRRCTPTCGCRLPVARCCRW